MKERKPTAKRITIDKFKEELKELNYSELNAAAIEIAFGLMSCYPNTWQKELATNRKHSAIMELMKEMKP